MAGEGGTDLPRLGEVADVPQDDAPVVTSGRHRSAIRGDGYGTHVVGVSSKALAEPLHVRSIADIPHDGGVLLAASGDQSVAVP